MGLVGTRATSWLVTLALFVGAAALFSGCGGEEEGGGKTANLGTAVFTVELPQEASAFLAARSALSGAGPSRAVALKPSRTDMASWDYTVTFAYLGGTAGSADEIAHDEENLDVEDDTLVGLDIGEWQFTGHGWLDDKEVGRYVSPSLSVEKDTLTEVTIKLEPYGEGTGTLSYEVELPSGYTGSFTITDTQGDEVLDEAGKPKITGLPVACATTQTKGTLPVPAGKYIVTAITGGANGWADNSTTVWIYEGNTTTYTWKPLGTEMTNTKVTDLNLRPYVPKPVAGNEMTSELLTPAEEFTGTIEWLMYETPATGQFLGQTSYTAIVTLTPKITYTFYGVKQNAFYHALAKSVKNPANSGIVTIEFAKTDGDYPVTGDLDIKLGFNYEAEAISVEGNDGANLIYKEGIPQSISFTALDTYATPKWWLDSDQRTGGVSNGGRTLLLNASDLALGEHSVMFVGTWETYTYSTNLKVTVKQRPAN